MSVTIDRQAAPQPLGTAAAGRALLRGMLVLLLLLPGVRLRFQAAGLG